ncbi:MAG TPA: DUF1552 domain-containing protein [Tepidisphaeraceae bacterium]|nr:DUF1552 domain-containing protein [Tepidisphaeraceae bacterium]
MNHPWHISRRTLLRGVGVAMALPLLEAMGDSAGAFGADATSPAEKAAAKFPTRMAVLYMPNGVNEHAWTPKGEGKNFELSPTLEPLADFKNDILVLSQLMNSGSLGGDGHYVKTAGFLTGTTITKTTGKDLRSGGVSMDQLAAQRVGKTTLLPSLELGIEPVTTGIDTNVGYTRLYGSHISWSTPTTPVAKEINPKLAFDRLFRPGREFAGRPEDDRSVLDLVAQDAGDLRKRIGATDQRKLDEYLESVRSVEKRIDFNTHRRAEENHLSPKALQEIEALDKRVQLWINHPGRERLNSIHVGADHTDHVRLMLDLMVLGFWSDSTRVSSFMFGNAVSPRNFSFLPGVHGGHHEISHHKNQAEALAQYQLINTWHVQQFAYLLTKMRDIPEGAGTLLDHSMLLFGAGMRDGNSHNPHNLPLVLAGQANGQLATGRHIAYAPKTPLCNLYVDLLDRMGAPVEHFGDSTEKLAGLDG